MKHQIHFCHAPDGVRIAYAKLGSGPPLVKAANWLSHLDFDRESPVWRHWLKDLSTERTFVRYDQRGCGLSDWDVEDFSFQAWVNDLEAVVDALGLKRFPLIGISQGGPIAIAYAIKHPQRVSHLILYGAYARGSMKRARSKQEMERARILIKLIKLGWGTENHAFRQLFTTLFLPQGRPDQLEWFNELQRISTTPDNAARILRQFDDIDVSQLAPAIKVPTIVLHAKGDARIPFEEGRLLAAMIPQAQFVPLDSSNHILLSDEPAWKQFVDEITRFMDDESQPGGQRHVSKGLEVMAPLTRRETEILELIARGLDNPEIADILFISPNTLRNHITRIFSKMAVSKRAEAIVCARKAGYGK